MKYRPSMKSRRTIFFDNIKFQYQYWKIIQKALNFESNLSNTLRVTKVFQNILRFIYPNHFPCNPPIDIEFQNQINTIVGWEMRDGRCDIRNTHCKWSWRCPKRIRLKFKNWFTFHYMLNKSAFLFVQVKSISFDALACGPIQNIYRTRIKTIIIDKTWNMFSRLMVRRIYEIQISWGFMDYFYIIKRSFWWGSKVNRIY